MLFRSQLSDIFQERILIDVDDLWDKQLRYGTAIEEIGDSFDGPFNMAAKYGIRFTRDSGKTGTLFLSEGGWKIKMDRPLEKYIRALAKRLKKKTKQVNNFQQEYNSAIANASAQGIKKLGTGNIELMVRFKDSRLAQPIEDSFKEMGDIGVELVDEEKIQKLQKLVKEKYVDKKYAGIGVPLEGLIAGGFIIFTVWSVKHIFDDVDNFLWERFKEVALRVLGSTKEIKTTQDEITIEFKDPQVLFIFPKKLNADDFLREMDSIKTLLQDIHNNQNHTSYSYEYRYELESGKWILKMHHLLG